MNPSSKDFDKGLQQAIEELIENGELDEGAPAYGVAQNAIYKGYHRLTRAQRKLYDAVLTPAFKRSNDRRRRKPEHRPSALPRPLPVAAVQAIDRLVAAAATSDKFVNIDTEAGRLVLTVPETAGMTTDKLVTTIMGKLFNGP